MTTALSRLACLGLLLAVSWPLALGLFRSLGFC